MHLLRSLRFFIALYDIDLDIQHIAGVEPAVQQTCCQEIILLSFSHFIPRFPDYPPPYHHPSSSSWDPRDQIGLQPALEFCLEVL